MLNKLKKAVLKLEDRFTATNESDTIDNGYLSYRAEWHSAAWGFAVGFLAVLTGQINWLVLGIGWLFTRGADGKVPGYIPYPNQFIKESGYLIGHCVAGAFAAALINLLLV